jgi:transcriptional regulator with XRE-family HTH domain
MTESVKRRIGLANFLKARRARLRPEQFNLPTFQRRRTRGLRREEIAQLIGVGVSWYTWLEQGRDIQVSDQVLERLTVILQLNEEERKHLFALARDAMPPQDERDDEWLVQNTPYQTILDSFVYPARLVDRRLNVVGWNESANRTFSEYARRSGRDRNTTWFVFTHPYSREMLVHWERTARQSVAFLHAIRDQYPDDAWLKDLIADLQQASSEFRTWWPEHDILLTCQGFAEINHPLVGRLALQPTTFVVPSRPDLRMIVYTPLPQEDTDAKLRRLTGKDFAPLQDMDVRL